MSAAAGSGAGAFAEQTPDQRSHYLFNIEGMRCANCASGIEKAVNALPGVWNISANAATGRASVEWNPQQVSLVRILDRIRNAGFKPVPAEGEASAAAEQRERRLAFKRIGVAGLGMMQTMMFVYALYAGGNHGIDAQIAQYLRIAGMLLTTPVMLYSGAPFFAAAGRDLQQHRLGMDVPVSVALLLAFAASVVHTLQGNGAVYFDSVTMFIFLLSLGRFAEMTVRRRSLSSSEAFARSVPAKAVRVSPEGMTQEVPVQDVAPGHVVRVPRGAVIPVDGKLNSVRAVLDESLITGESRPVGKASGATVLGGSINAGDTIDVFCTTAAESSTLASIVALLRRVGAERPRSVAAADTAASLFSAITLLLAGAVAIYWEVVQPANVMTATLAVLVVTCPCALSLATPAALAAVSSRLARIGLLVVKPDAVERLSRIDTVVFDKTGTLTSARLSARVKSLRTGYVPETVLRIAAALERESSHPLARAFAEQAHPAVRATDVREFVGRGIEGTVEGIPWRLGRADFVAELTGENSGSAAIELGKGQGVIAALQIEDNVEAGARSAVEALAKQGLRLAIASGDSPDAVMAVAGAVGITEHHSRMDFDAKCRFIKDLQRGGATVLMVGDGINDGPVLAAANVSCALTEGSAIAHAAADLLLLNRSLGALGEGVGLARRARRVMYQNLAWALLYNITMVPLAAAGAISPWVAALGMSGSSLAVVLNSARLARAKSS